ncbi:hypothetical protein JJB09_12685 [Rhizobium sp. KVB221]|uniref:Uncharacterized protein n=1 Tax=Rhizobium setariae TaxID=2801340 RepID=A0A936YM29_9HYPH|nr:hypothetical protein [Rhizobium setariae]MBL0372883.1 hypothetical protein [Rhizobium setariae]
MKAARNALQVVVTATSIAAAAMALPAIMLVAGASAQPVLALFPRPISIGALPPGVSILDWDGRVARLASVDAGQARALYQAGALMVLPYRQSGCMSLREK